MVAIRLEERTTGIEATYFLIVQQDGKTREINLGSALKDSTFTDGQRLSVFHAQRRSLAVIFNEQYLLPTPPILQYFSDKPLENVLTAGQRLNIHPVEELKLARILLERLVEIEPAIADENAQPRLTRIGNKRVTPDDIQKLRAAYQHFSYAHA